MIEFHLPDPEFAESFRAYRNYVEDLAGCIGGEFGLADTLVAGVHDAVLAHPPVKRVNRKPLGSQQRQFVGKELRKSWGNVHRVAAEVHSPWAFDEEANAWIPTMAYYAVYYAVSAYAAASQQAVPRDHRAGLNLIAKDVKRGMLPYPWSACCEAGPKDAVTFAGFPVTFGKVHVLSTPDPSTSEARLGMFLRTTRQKELERRFAEERGRRKPAPGRTRCNLSHAEKTRMAAKLQPTTIFDLFWRMRTKANYDDADAFVLGAGDELDAHRLGNGLAIVTDATVAALEALTAAYIGAAELAAMSEAYRDRRSAAPGSAVGRRAASWGRRAGRVGRPAVGP